MSGETPALVHVLASQAADARILATKLALELRTLCIMVEQEDGPPVTASAWELLTSPEVEALDLP